jgi:hypothetical protein
MYGWHIAKMGFLLPSYFIWKDGRAKDQLKVKAKETKKRLVKAQSAPTAGVAESADSP